VAAEGVLLSRALGCAQAVHSEGKATTEAALWLEMARQGDPAAWRTAIICTFTMKAHCLTCRG
jgi:hypothetical protein